MTKKHTFYIIRRKSGDTMLNNKKYILQKTAKYALCTVLAITIVHQVKTITNTSIPFTQEDLKNNEIYASEIVEIQKTKPS